MNRPAAVGPGLRAQAAPRCVVCDAALAHRPGIGDGKPDPFPTCHAVTCRMVVDRRVQMGDAGFRHYLGTQAQQRQRQALLAAASAAVSAARRQAEAEENARAWAALRARLALAPADEALRLSLPSGPLRARRLAAGRRARYLAHLLKIAGEAAAAAPTGPTGPSGPDIGADSATPAVASSLPGRLCALCGGGCCTRGGEHAYLSAPTLRRFMDAHPGLSTDQVVAAYLDRVAVKTQSGSCINHTRDGCSLPRAMRSDICNSYACESLTRLQAAHHEHPVQVVLIVRRRQDQWRRADPGLDNAFTGGAVLRESGTLRVPAAFLRAPAAGA